MAIVEEDHEDHAAGNVREIHGFLLALVKERVELGLADEAGELVVGAEVGGGERREGGGVEPRLLADGGDQLAGAVDEQRAAGVAVIEELLERLLNRAEIVLGERPACCTNGHCVSAYARDASIRRRMRRPRRLSLACFSQFT
jgi:hypothetical protein